MLTCEGLSSGHHSWPRVATETYYPAGLCWAVTKLFPVSSEWLPGKPKLNKGLPELARAAACQDWALHFHEGLGRVQALAVGGAAILPYRYGNQGSWDLNLAQLTGSSHRKPVATI